MPQPILIEFVTNLDAVEKAIDSLEQLGMVDKQTADSFRKTSATVKEANKDLKDTSKAAETVKIDMQELADALNQIPDKIVDDAAKKGLKDLGDETTKLTGKTAKLTTELRNIKQEMSQLELAGKTNSARYRDLAMRAGTLQDQIGDTSQRVRILASDTKQLDAALSLATGVAGGFSVAQGMAALFGSENEELQKTLMKVQGALALVNGLQAVAATLNKDSAASVIYLGGAQKLYAKYITQATGAQKAFNIAAAASVVGLVVVGVIAAVNAFKRYSAALHDANRESELTKKINEEAIDGYAEATVELQNYINVVQDSSTTDAEKRDILKEVNEKYGDQIGLMKNIDELDTKFIEKADVLIKIYRLRAEAQAAMNLATEEFQTILKNQNNGIEENINFWDKSKMAVNAYWHNWTGMGKNIEAVQERANDVIADATKNQDFYLGKYNELSAAAAKLAKENQINLDGSTKKTKENTDEVAKNIQSLHDWMEAQKEIQLQMADALGTDKDRELAAVDQKYDLLINKARAFGFDVTALYEQQAKDRAAIEDKYTQKNIDGMQEWLDAFNQVQEQVNAVSMSDNEAEIAAVEKKYEALAAMARKFGIDTTSIYDAMEKEKTEIKKRQDEEQKKSDDDKARAEIENRQKVAQMYQLIGMQILEGGQAILNAANSNEQTALDEQLENRLISQEEYERRSKELRRKEAQQEKFMAVFKALLNIPVAVIEGLLRGGIPLSILFGAIATTEAAAIAATKVPGFIEGVEWLTGGQRGKDSIPAMLAPHERVITADVNEDYFPILSAIHNRQISADFLNAIAEMPDFGMLMGMMGLGNIDIAGGSEFDYNRFEKSLKRAMGGQQQNHLHMDANGFTRYVVNGSNRTKYYEERYSSN